MRGEEQAVSLGGHANRGLVLPILAGRRELRAAQSRRPLSYVLLFCALIATLIDHLLCPASLQKLVLQVVGSDDEAVVLPQPLVIGTLSRAFFGCSLRVLGSK